VKDTCGNLIQADTSAFYPNSFAYWQGYNLLLPSQSGGDFYTDCNGNGQRDSSDGANPIQTWDIALSVQATGLNLPNFTANQPALVYPNPCSEQVHVGLPGCSWDLWDALGKRRASGVGKAILSCKNLPAGCYVVGPGSTVGDKSYVDRKNGNVAVIPTWLVALAGAGCPAEKSDTPVPA
jgi:hypothetical protein